MGTCFRLFGVEHMILRIVEKVDLEATVSFFDCHCQEIMQALVKTVCVDLLREGIPSSMLQVILENIWL